MKCQIGEYCVAGATEPRQQDNRQQASAKHQPTNRGGPKTHLKRKARGHLRTGETVGSGGQDRGCKSNSRELHGLVYGGLVRKKRIERRCCSQPQKAKQWLRFTVEGEERRSMPTSILSFQKIQMRVKAGSLVGGGERSALLGATDVCHQDFCVLSGT